MSAPRKSICLVTEELAGDAPTGGIGSAILELAELLAIDHDVTVLFCPLVMPDARRQKQFVALMKSGRAQIFCDFGTRFLRLLFTRLFLIWLRLFRPDRRLIAAAGQ